MRRWLTEMTGEDWSKARPGTDTDKLSQPAPDITRRVTRSHSRLRSCHRQKKMILFKKWTQFKNGHNLETDTI